MDQTHVILSEIRRVGSEIEGLLMAGSLHYSKTHLRARFLRKPFPGATQKKDEK